jgi:hypothetical protein
MPRSAQAAGGESVLRAILKSGRVFILLLAIAATLNITLASTSPAHLHLDSSSPNRCDLCFTAHTTVFETPAVLPVYGPEIAARTAPILPFFGYEASEGRRHCSRGPPASSL